MIAASLAVAPFGADDAARFPALLRAPPGRSVQCRHRGTLLLAQVAPSGAAWVEGRAGSGWTVLFAGQLHNRREIASELGTTPERVSDEKYKAVQKLRTHFATT